MHKGRRRWGLMGAAASRFVMFLESEIMSNRFEIFAHLEIEGRRHERRRPVPPDIELFSRPLSGIIGELNKPERLRWRLAYIS